MAWTNEDGLLVRFNRERGEVTDDGVTSAEEKIFRLTFDFSDIADTDTAAEAGDRPFIPAGAVIKDSYLIVTTTFTSGGLAVLDIGTKQSAGTTIDDDGINAAIAVGSLTADAVIAGAGAQVGTRLATDAYPTTTYDTAAFTAGAAELVIKYIQVT